MYRETKKRICVISIQKNESSYDNRCIEYVISILNNITIFYILVSQNINNMGNFSMTFNLNPPLFL